jgi:hypothetical protein
MRTPAPRQKRFTTDADARVIAYLVVIMGIIIIARIALFSQAQFVLGMVGGPPPSIGAAHEAAG